MPIFKLPNKKVVLFIHIPKSGGTSVEQQFRRTGCEEFLFNSKADPYFKCSSQHLHRDSIEQLIDLTKIDYIFTVVRNPVSRIISEYKFRSNQKLASQGIDQWYSAIQKQYKTNPFINDNHIRPSHEFIVNQCKIFKLEDGLEQLFQTLGKKLSFAKLGTTKTQHAMTSKQVMEQRQDKNMTSDISNTQNFAEPSIITIRNIISDYSTDFDLFGYKKNAKSYLSNSANP